MKSFQEVKDKLLKDKYLKKEYELLEKKYKIISREIEVQKNKSFNIKNYTKLK